MWKKGDVLYCTIQLITIFKKFQSLLFELNGEALAKRAMSHDAE